MKLILINRTLILLVFISAGGLANLLFSSGGQGIDQSTEMLDPGEALTIFLYQERDITIVVQSEPKFEGTLAILDRKGYEKWASKGEFDPLLIEEVKVGFLLNLSYPRGIYAVVLLSNSHESHDLQVMIRSKAGIPKAIRDKLLLMTSASSVFAILCYLVRHEASGMSRVKQGEAREAPSPHAA